MCTLETPVLHFPLKCRVEQNKEIRTDSGRINPYDRESVKYLPLLYLNDVRKIF